MAKRPANPNTAYGRKRLRQEYHQRVADMSPEDRQKHQSDVTTVNVWLWIIAIAICLIAFMVGGLPSMLSAMKVMSNQ